MHVRIGGQMGYWIADATARRWLATAAAAAPYRCVEIPPDRLVYEADVLGRLSGIVWDAEPLSALAMAVVRHVRAAQPALPILLYVEPRRDTLAFRQVAGEIPGVTVRVQSRDRREAGTLRSFLLKWLATAPAPSVDRMLGAVLPRRPAGLTELARAVLERLSREAAGIPAVDRVAAQLGISTGTLRMRCLAAEVPAPEELAAWITLLFVVSVAQWSGASAGSVAAACGLSGERFAALRRELVPVAITDAARPQQVLDLTLLAFAARCRSSAVPVSEVLPRASG